MGAFSILSVAVSGLLVLLSAVLASADISKRDVQEFALREVTAELQNLKERLAELERGSQVGRRNVDFDADGEAYTVQCVFCPRSGSGPPGPPGPPGIPGRDGRDQCGGGGDRPVPPPFWNDTTGGSVYVRWGRDECGTGSELIYSGIAAGGHYNQKGNGANHLCMPDNPIFDEPQAGSGSQNRANIYGAEYEMNTFTMWNSIHDNNVPCAVCYAPYRPALLVIPARNVCPPEWYTEYTGFMAASFHNHPGRTEFVCLDRNPSTIPRSSHNADGLLFYVAEAKCGSGGSGLPCGPYVDGNEVTCAVCTR